MSTSTLAGYGNNNNNSIIASLSSASASSAVAAPGVSRPPPPPPPPRPFFPEVKEKLHAVDYSLRLLPSASVSVSASASTSASASASASAAAFSFASVDVQAQSVSAASSTSSPTSSSSSLLTSQSILRTLITSGAIDQTVDAMIHAIMSGDGDGDVDGDSDGDGNNTFESKLVDSFIQKQLIHTSEYVRIMKEIEDTIAKGGGGGGGGGEPNRALTMGKLVTLANKYFQLQPTTMTTTSISSQLRTHAQGALARLAYGRLNTQLFASAQHPQAWREYLETTTTTTTTQGGMLAAASASASASASATTSATTTATAESRFDRVISSAAEATILNAQNDLIERSNQVHARITDRAAGSLTASSVTPSSLRHIINIDATHEQAQPPIFITDEPTPPVTTTTIINLIDDETTSRKRQRDEEVIKNENESRDDTAREFARCSRRNAQQQQRDGSWSWQ